MSEFIRINKGAGWEKVNRRGITPLNGRARRSPLSQVQAWINQQIQGASHGG